MVQNFGDMVKTTREKLDLTIRELAERIDCSPNSLFRYEHEKSVPRIERFERMKSILGLNWMNYEDLLYEKSFGKLRMNLDYFWKKLYLFQLYEAEEPYRYLREYVRNRNNVSDYLKKEIRIAECTYMYMTYLLEEDMTQKESGDDVTFSYLKNGISECVIGGSPEKVNLNEIRELTFLLTAPDIIGYNLYALILIKEGNYERAAEIFDALILNCIRIGKVSGENTKVLMILLCNLALSYICLGKYEEAVAILAKNERNLFRYADNCVLLHTCKLKEICYRDLKMNEEYQKEKRALDYLLEMHMKPEIKTACKNHISNEKIGLLIFRN